MFRSIESDNFPPFGKLRLMLPEVPNKPPELAEVHLLTGVNGTGKTRLLTVLAAMLGYDKPLLRRLNGASSSSFFTTSTGLGDLAEVSSAEYVPSPENSRWLRITDHFAKWLGGTSAFAYGGNAYVTDTPIAVMDAVPKVSRHTCLSFARTEGDSQALLQAITNLKIQAAMDAMNSATDVAIASRSIRTSKALEATVSQITGRDFSFHVTSYPTVNITVNWGKVRLPFIMLPDGLRGIVGSLVHAAVMMDLWLEGKGDPKDTEAVFLLDEIESHLHPVWQRRILPAFQRLFPKAQIFVATHSPFVIASLNHGWIHPLTVGTDGLVKCETPVPASEGDSYVSVLEDIMGLKEWYDEETENLLAEFRNKRDAAYRAEAGAREDARTLAGKIGDRSMELGYMMGRELSQMDRQLAKMTASK